MSEEDTNSDDVNVNDSVLFKAIQEVDREAPVDAEDPDDLTFLSEEEVEEAAEKVRSEDEESQSTEEEESSEETEEPDEEVEDTQEEEQEDLPETTSNSAKESFAKLRDAKETWKTKATEYEQQVETLKSQLESAPATEEVDKLKEELSQYKDIVESEHFQQDPAFIAEYKNPVDTAYADVAKWARAGLVSEDVIKEAGPAINVMAELLGSSDKEAEYLQAASDVSDLFEKPAFASRFVTAAERWFEAGKNYNEAISDKEQTQKYLTQKRKDRMDKERKTVTGMLDSSHSSWEATNPGMVSFYKDNADKFNYTEEVTKGKEEAKRLFQNFFDTGAVSRELSDFVTEGGVIGGVQRQAQGVMVELLKANTELIESKNKAIEDLEGQLEALGGKKRKTSSGNSYLEAARSGGAEEDSDTGSVLVGALKKFR